MSRLTVAWVTGKPRSRRSPASSSWLPIARAATRSRIVRRRAGLTGSGVMRLVPRRLAREPS